MKEGVRVSNDECAASVSPLEGVPKHPDLIDPGPAFTNTGIHCACTCICHLVYVHVHVYVCICTCTCVRMYMYMYM